MNKVVGLGFGGVPADAGTAWSDDARARRPVQVELSNLADPAIAAALTGRGYVLTGFENVLGRALPSAEARSTAVEVRVVRRRRTRRLGRRRRRGLRASRGEGTSAHEEFPRESSSARERDFAAAGATAYLALCDGTIAGGGACG